MKRRFLVFLIVLSILLSACGNSDDTKADAYIEIAQEYVEKGEVKEALEILKKGYSETSDERLAVMMAELVLESDDSVSTETRETSPAVTETKPKETEPATEATQPVTESTETLEFPTQREFSVISTIPNQGWYEMYRPVLDVFYLEFVDGNLEWLQLRAHYFQYTLHDVNNDGFPELILTAGGNDGDCQAYIYGIKEDKVIYWGSFYGLPYSISGIYGEEGLIVTGGRQGIEHISLITANEFGVKQEWIFDGVARNIHSFEDLRFYDYDDMSGLYWYGNVMNDNLSKLKALREEVALQQKDVLNDFSRDRRYEINFFLSKFCEQRYQIYPMDYYAMLNFAFVYASVNETDKISVENGVYSMQQTDVDKILTRFFAQTVVPQDTPYTFTSPISCDIVYDGTTYRAPLKMAGAYNYVTAAYDMFPRDDGNYDVYFDVYEVDLATYNSKGLNDFYTVTPSYDIEYSYYGQLKLYGTGYAVVRDYIDASGNKTYQLISYKLDIPS